MSTAANLRDSLQKINSEIEIHFRPVRWPTTVGVDFTLPDATETEQAKTEFIANRRIHSLKQATVVAHFLFQVTNTSQDRSIIDDDELFDIFFSNNLGIGRWLETKIGFTRIMRGLTKSYLEYPAKETTSDLNFSGGFHKLREFILRHVGDLPSGPKCPKWISIILQNFQLFSENPCGVFASEIIESGASTRFEEIVSVFDVSESSWFRKEIIAAQIRSVVDSDDVAFIFHLEGSLANISKLHIMKVALFSAIINRYANLRDPMRNHQLAERAIEWLGHPWIPTSEAGWYFVDSAARGMISAWLKDDYVTAFFTKLSDDRLSDTRRLNFWRRYIRSMTQVRFAIGTSVRDARDSDLRALIAKMRGLTSYLESSENAFLISFEKLLIVEFSKSGNACYLYAVTNGIPFDTSRALKTQVNAPNSLKYKGDDFLPPFLHQDRPDTWEVRMEIMLRTQYGIFPDEASASQNSGDVAKTNNLKLKTVSHHAKDGEPAEGISNSARSNLDFAMRSSMERNHNGEFEPIVGEKNGSIFNWFKAKKMPFSMLNLFALTQADNIVVVDNLEDGGYLWVRADLSDPDRNEALSAWGFEYMPNQGWSRS